MRVSKVSPPYRTVRRGVRLLQTTVQRNLCGISVSRTGKNKAGSLAAMAPDGVTASLLHYRHKRPIGSHFHSGGRKFSYLGEDLEEALGEPGETIARKTVWEATAEHLHDM